MAFVRTVLRGLRPRARSSFGHSILRTRPTLPCYRFLSTGGGELPRRGYGKAFAAVAVGGSIIAGVSFYGAPTLDDNVKGNEAVKWQLFFLRTLPTRLLSRLWGAVNDLELPLFLRAPIFRLWTVVFNCNLDEMKDPLESYKNLGEFFARSLRDGVRPICEEGMASPVDGTVLHFGRVSGDVIYQVRMKGVKYSLTKLLGVHMRGIPEVESIEDVEAKEKEEEEKSSQEKEESWLEQWLPASISTSVVPSWKELWENKGAERVETIGPKADIEEKRLYFITMYLAPGDYHNYHAPVDMTIEKRKHFAGELLPVAPAFAEFVPGLFDINERVALLGKWEQGFFSFTAIGATNVGSIVMYFDKELKTNRFTLRRPMEGHGSADTRHYDQNPFLFKKGEEVGGFRLGSTVVLVFEADEDFEFVVKRGQKIKMGQKIAENRSPKQLAES